MDASSGDHAPNDSRRGSGGWLLAMRWEKLLFAHWPVETDRLRSFIPSDLDIDTHDGRAWLGVVPFRMTGIRARGLPPIPFVSSFPELNLRTYVRCGDRVGVWFFSLDAAHRLAVATARWTFSLPYFNARMRCDEDGDGWVNYESVRTHRGAPVVEFVGRYRPAGAPCRTEPDSLPEFLTKRYCLFAQNRRGRILRGDIHHEPWELCDAELEIERLTLAAPLRIRRFEGEPILHYSDRLDVVAWSPEAVS
ncbi:MAG: YqjF family protein [Phycisphaerales bacterium]